MVLWRQTHNKIVTKHYLGLLPITCLIIRKLLSGNYQLLFSIIIFHASAVYFIIIIISSEIAVFLSFFFRKKIKNFRFYGRKKFPKQRKHSIFHVCFYLATFYADDYVEKSIKILGLSAANGINILMRSCHFMKNTFLQKQTFAIHYHHRSRMTKVFFSIFLLVYFEIFSLQFVICLAFSADTLLTLFFQRQMFLNNFFEDKRVRHEKKERRLWRAILLFHNFFQSPFKSTLNTLTSLLPLRKCENDVLE